MQADTSPSRSSSSIREASDLPRLILQQDNGPRHTAKVIKSYLQPEEEHEVLGVTAWPHRAPISPSWSVSGISGRSVVASPRCSEQPSSPAAQFLHKLCIPRRPDAAWRLKDAHSKHNIYSTGCQIFMSARSERDLDL